MSVDVAIEKATKTVGEGPHWDERTQSLLYVDILCGDVHRWNSVTGKTESLHFDEDVSLIVPCRKGGYIIGIGRKLVHLDWESGKTTTLQEVEQGKNTRFNDGKCDVKGRLWAGTMANETAPAVLEHEQGSLYSLDVDGSFKQHVEKISISNGLCWTADGRTMYYIDSIPRKVYAFDYDMEKGTLSNQRTAVDFNSESVEELGYPDGMAIDVEDKIWVACFYAGKVVRFDPKTGEKLRVVNIPGKRTTSCCFGGKNFDELYVTVGTRGATEEELKAYPLTGSIFRVTGLGVKGLPAPIYEG